MSSVERGVLFPVDEAINNAQSSFIQFAYHALCLDENKKWSYPNQSDAGIDGIKTMELFRKYVSAKRMPWTSKILYVIYIYIY